MSEQKIKRKMKDSVFTALFKQPEYLLQLYQALHPKDQSITAGDLKLITLENVLSDGLYKRLILYLCMWNKHPINNKVFPNLLNGDSVPPAYN